LLIVLGTDKAFGIYNFSPDRLIGQLSVMNYKELLSNLSICTGNCTISMSIYYKKRESFSNFFFLSDKEDYILAASLYSGNRGGKLVERFPGRNWIALSQHTHACFFSQHNES
jgi:hypothetical protein